MAAQYFVHRYDFLRMPPSTTLRTGKTCPMTGATFETPAREMELRKKLGIPGEPKLHPVFRFMQLGAFWQQWNLHKRACDKTGKSIIAVFPADCPYPVWQRDEWIKHADPPGTAFDPVKPFFAQLWELFRRSPIPHNVGAGNENCEYTDDWWYCRNCYLCHSGVQCEDLHGATTCGRCRTQVETGWPKEYDGRILCEGCYLKEVY